MYSKVLELRSYAESKWLQLLFKVKFLKDKELQTIKCSTVKSLFGKVYSNVVPWSGQPDSTFYSDLELRTHSFGEYGSGIKVNWKTDRDNPCIWMLQLDKGKVQEIDVFESNKVDGKRGLYFSIYNNEKSNAYFSDPVNRKGILYDRFQTRMRWDRLMDYLGKNVIEYKVKWEPNKVTWYIADIPVAVSYIYVPSQEMSILLTNYKGR
jgi:beta-glucanase (GH16 family)